mmetsp:Transcript_40218/g.52945  ORF Transcript_40218/g.52945 Transcript_40218/m.52945 type:complete len:262 (+) Transcript_40218:105-890(+)
MAICEQFEQMCSTVDAKNDISRPNTTHSKKKYIQRSKHSKKRGFSISKMLKNFLEQVMNPEQKPDQRIIYTPFQELLNCVSMTFPTLLCIWYIQNPEVLIYRNSWLMMIGTFTHCPFSVIYHGLCSFGYDSEFWKRADLTFIHFCFSIYAYAFSSSLLYFAAIMLVNIRYVLNIWAKTGRHKAERSKNIFVSVILSLLPIGAMGDWQNFTGALLWFLLGGISFQVNFIGGYGHSLFHTLFVGFQYYLFKASQLAALNTICL